MSESIGLLSNQTAFDTATGKYLFELLNEQGKLRRLFLPEHGLFAELQDQVSLGATHIYRYLRLDAQIVSLYGENESTLVPDASLLADLDTLLVDIQDVGARYYTFATTLSYIFDILIENKISLNVEIYDRPNPAGRQVEGSILAPEFASFVGRPGLPHRHGLTMGELAIFYREQVGGQFPLTIYTFEDGIPGKEYPEGVSIKTQRDFNRKYVNYDTRLANQSMPQFIIPPSPNMPGPITAEIYAGQCLLEGTNLSEGRGTTRPFEIFGAPGMEFVFSKGRGESPVMDQGAILRPLKFIPTFHKYADRTCDGYQLIPLKDPSYHSLAHSLKILRFIKENAPHVFGWREGPYEFRSDRPAIELLTGDWLLVDYLHGKSSFRDVHEKFRSEEMDWMERAIHFQIYQTPLTGMEIKSEFDYA